MPGDREYHIDDETRAALQTSPGVRFLLRAKLRAESRHSSDVIPWAQSLAERVARAVAEAAGHQLTHFAIHLTAIKLLHPPAGDDKDQFSENPDQPIHEIIKRANNYHVIRSKRLDDTVAETYKSLREYHGGPRPYFRDTRYLSLHVDGRRIERPKDGEPRDPDEPEGWDWEQGFLPLEEDELYEDGGEERE